MRTRIGKPARAPAIAILIGVVCAIAFSARATDAPVSRELLSHAGDYGFLWWAHGWRGRSPEGHRIFCVQTNRYGFAFDLERASVTHLGRIEQPLPELQAVAQSNDVIFNLPEVQLAGTLEVGGRTYRAVSVAPKPEDARIIEHGRFLQRMELLGLRFVDDAGTALSDIKASYEVVCWPDRWALILHIEPTKALEKPKASLRLRWKQKGLGVSDAGPRARLIGLRGHPSRDLVILRPTAAEWLNEPPGSGEIQVGFRTPEAPWWPGKREQSLAMIVMSFDAADGVSLNDRIAHELEPREADTVRARGLAPYRHPLQVSYDEARGWYWVQLGRHDADGWEPADDPDRLERVALALRSTDASARTIRLVFAKDEKFEGVVGMAPMIRDAEGIPVGLPVQISKNWHESTWFHGATMARLAAGATADVEFTMAFAHWGKVPMASLAQLCLVGWGMNQVWHQVALGGYGETFCYDPDICLNRAMIDDMRPLLVGSMMTDLWQRSQGGWTNNVGGGDFLVCVDESGKRQFLSRMRTSYGRYGPNLVEATYAGQTQDCNIDVVITHTHYRCDDLTRGLYRLRYDVRRPCSYRRLAFFQLGADQYNDHQFRTMARGNQDGLTEEWKPQASGTGYDRTAIPCEGDVSWFSLHDAVPDPKQPGAWADRGLVIRGWRARLAGRDAPAPFAAVWRTQNGPRSVLLEIGPPPGTSRLEPGDFVEAEIELIVLPMAFADYYGPNRALREALERHANTWRMVHREAVGNALTVTAGKGSVESSYPVRVRCDDRGDAAFTIRGGVGYLPITIAGVRDYRRCILERQQADRWIAVDQASQGSDFWQADYRPASGTWDLTFNVPADREKAADELSFRLR